LNEIEQIKQGLADSAAISDVECLLDRVGEFSEGWYDTETCQKDDESELLRAMKYLAHRDLIEKHPDNKYLVRIKRA
jgi:hypothetical protein